VYRAGDLPLVQRFAVEASFLVVAGLIHDRIYEIPFVTHQLKSAVEMLLCRIRLRRFLENLVAAIQIGFLVSAAVGLRNECL
jgi:hypothetical protein